MDLALGRPSRSNSAVFTEVVPTSKVRYMAGTAYNGAHKRASDGCFAILDAGGDKKETPAHGATYRNPLPGHRHLPGVRPPWAHRGRARPGQGVPGPDHGLLPCSHQLCFHRPEPGLHAGLVLRGAPAEPAAP